MVMPTIAYGAYVWAKSAKDIHQKALTRVTRIAIDMVAPTKKSSPTAGLEVILGLTPWDIYLELQGLNQHPQVKAVMPIVILFLVTFSLLYIYRIYSQ